MDREDLSRCYPYKFFGLYQNFKNGLEALESGRRYTSYTFLELWSAVRHFKSNVKTMCSEGTPPDFDSKRKNLKDETLFGTEFLKDEARMGESISIAC